MKFLPPLLLAVLGITAVSRIEAQARPTAEKSATIEAGVGYMYLNNDYTERKNQGGTAWVDYDFAKVRPIRIGVDATIHLGGIITPDDIGENTYLVGPRLSYRRHSLEVYGKIVVGRGTITNQIYNTSSSFNVYALAGGVDYLVKPHFKLRAEFEQQKWPNFEPRTLSPLALSVGVLYVIR